METLLSELETELQELFDAHTCTVSELLKFKRDAQFEILPKLTRKRASCTVFDLHEARFVYHSSVHHKWLNETCIDLNKPNNCNQLAEITHPDDRINVLKIKLKGYAEISNLPAEKRKDFTFSFPCRLRDKKGGYQLYIHCISVMQCDDKGVPWLMLIVTERLPERCYTENCTADIYELYTKLNYSGNTKNDFNLSEHQLKILGMIYDGHKQVEIANKLNVSKHTIHNHYTAIRKKLNARTIQIAAIYAKIIGLLSMVLVV